MMFAVRAFSKAAAPARAVTSRVKVVAPNRAMGSGAAPKYEGIEAKVRAVLPKDEHLVVGIMGFYVGLYGIFKVVSAAFSSPKKVEAPVAAPAPTSGSEIPTGDDEFYKWLEGEGNMEKYLATIEMEK